MAKGTWQLSCSKTSENLENQEIGFPSEISGALLKSTSVLLLANQTFPDLTVFAAPVCPMISSVSKNLNANAETFYPKTTFSTLNPQAEPFVLKKSEHDFLSASYSGSLGTVPTALDLSTPIFSEESDIEDKETNISKHLAGDLLNDDVVENVLNTSPSVHNLSTPQLYGKSDITGTKYSDRTPSKPPIVLDISTPQLCEVIRDSFLNPQSNDLSGDSFDITIKRD